MNNNVPNGYTSVNGQQTNESSATNIAEQKTVYSPDYTQQIQYYTPPQDPYNQLCQGQNRGTDILGILSVIFSAVGIGCCGFQFAVIGIVTGIIAMVKAKNAMQKSSLGLVGVILGAVSVVMYILLIIAYFTIIAASMSQIDNLL